MSKSICVDKELQVYMKIKRSGEEWKVDFVKDSACSPVISLAPFPVATTTFAEAERKGLAGWEIAGEHYRGLFCKNNYAN